MDKKYFLHRNNIITGPFDRAALLTMLKNGTISLFDMLSTDKKQVQKICTVLDIAVPEIAIPVTENTQENPAIPPAHQAAEPAVCANETSIVRPTDELAVKPVKLTLFETLSYTVESLFNAESAQHKLLSAGSEVMTFSSIFAIFISLMVSALGVLFYGRFYQAEFSIILARGMLWTVLSGIFSFLYCRIIKAASRPSDPPPGTDFMLSAHVMMYASWLLLIANGVMFLLNRQLFAFNFRQLAAAFIIALLPGIFFLLNQFLTIRLNLMQNKSLNKDAAAGWAGAAIWLLSIIFFFIQYAVYKI